MGGIKPKRPLMKDTSNTKQRIGQPILIELKLQNPNLMTETLPKIDEIREEVEEISL